jgi:hypothetical protein
MPKASDNRYRQVQIILLSKKAFRGYLYCGPLKQNYTARSFLFLDEHELFVQLSSTIDACVSTTIKGQIEFSVRMKDSKNVLDFSRHCEIASFTKQLCACGVE